MSASDPKLTFAGFQDYSAGAPTTLARRNRTKAAMLATDITAPATKATPALPARSAMPPTESPGDHHRPVIDQRTLPCRTEGSPATISWKAGS